MITFLTPQSAEPAPASVVLSHGITGTAFQRWASDDLWHSTVACLKPSSWEEILTLPNLVLVYSASTDAPGRLRPNRQAS